MEFEDGKVYEFMTPIGIMSLVSDHQAQIPVRVYGPDGLQIDPTIVAKMTNCPRHGCLAGFMAWDLGRLVSN